MNATASTVVPDAAVAYAERGWPVFPLHPIVDGRCECGGADCAGKHPATTGWQRTIAPSAAGAEATMGAAARPAWDRSRVRAASGSVGSRRRSPPRRGRDRSGEPAGAGTASCRGRLRLAPAAAAGICLFRWADGVRSETAPGGSGRASTCAVRAAIVVLPPSPHVSGRRYEWVFAPR